MAPPPESKIHEWIKAPDASPSYNAARKKHQPGTGSWFINGPQFLEWKEQPGSLLWLYGGRMCSFINKFLIALTISRSWLRKDDLVVGIVF